MGGILHTEKGDFKQDFDMVLFGSPCQSFSRCMNKDMRIGLADDIRSGVFLDCYRVLKEVNPKWFLVENVIMKPEDENILSKMLGVLPIRINSSLLSAQSRDRLYWTNIPDISLPEDKHIKLQDIIIDGYSYLDKSRCLMMCDSHSYYNGCSFTPALRYHRSVNKGFSTVIFNSERDFENCCRLSDKILGGRNSKAKLFESYKGDEFNCFRYLWKEERAKLQTVPAKYVECLSEKEAADLLGDGWTVDVVAHILSHIKRDSIPVAPIKIREILNKRENKLF